MLRALLILVALAAPADELDQHVAAQRTMIDDTRRPIAIRERLASELASALDRAAHSATKPEDRRRRWQEAIDLLEGFNEQTRRHIQADAFGLQAAIYRWAIARDDAAIAESRPADVLARDRAARGLDAAIARLRALDSTRQEPLASNVRYRLAQALADRADIEAVGEARTSAREEAARMLAKPCHEPGLRGYGEILRAELLARLGRFDEADAALKLAEATNPPAADLRAARVEVALAHDRPDDAWRVVEGARPEEPGLAPLAVRVRLAQRAARPPGPSRDAAEVDAFRRLDAFRAADPAGARPVLAELARRVERPCDGVGPEGWDTLAEARLVVGDLAGACDLAAEGAERAEAIGRPDRARPLRFRAAAIAYQAGKFARAEALLAPLAADAGAGPLRPKASLLRILSMGRARAVGEANASTDKYRDALESHLREHPADPSTDEVRWLLGRVRLDAGDRPGAVALWSAIAAGTPRRLDARLAVGGLLRRDVEESLIGGDLDAARKRLDLASSQCHEALAEATRPADRATLTLAGATLDLIPGVERPEQARRAADPLINAAPSPSLQALARLIRAVAQAELGRYVEAERDAREALPSASPADLVLTLRLLDRFATAADTDVARRRVGTLMRTVADRALDIPNAPTAAELYEANLRRVRSSIHRGDLGNARVLLRSWGGPSDPPDVDALRDLADTYARLDDADAAADAYRLLMGRVAPASPAWFDARLGLATALAASGRADQARQLVQATAILHADLGGGTLKGRFERLMSRLVREPNAP